MSQPLTIWSNYTFPPAADSIIRKGIAPHRLLMAANMGASNLSSTPADDSIYQADIILGQPDPDALLKADRVKWVHLTSAGYDRYDRPDLRQAFASRGAVLTNSSAVYEDPCAQHVFSMMMAVARQLPQSVATQLDDRSWPINQRRIDSVLLTHQTALILSFGAIAQRLVQFLTPFEMKIFALRRKPHGDEKVQIIGEADLPKVLLQADHVINVLPGGPSTRHFMNAERFGLMKPSAVFYNIGRGSTVDQAALLAALNKKRLRYAYLDVTEPEPLPPDHPLWSNPRCSITPHTAGGAIDEFERLAQHFLSNLRKFTAAEKLANRVI
jgi:phosphoglycerate dehydrogenase-like enzyme